MDLVVDGVSYEREERYGDYYYYDRMIQTPLMLARSMGSANGDRFIVVVVGGGRMFVCRCIFVVVSVIFVFLKFVPDDDEG